MAYAGTKIWGGNILIETVDDAGQITSIRIPKVGVGIYPCAPSTVAQIKALFPHLNPTPRQTNTTL